MPSRISTALVFATAAEGAPLMSRLGFRRIPGRGLTCFRRSIQSADIIAVVSGMGKTNSAHAAGAVIREFRPGMVINFGVGGAYPDAGLSTGDIAVATTEVYADEGVILHDGFHPIETIGIPLATVRGRKYFNEFPLDRILARKAMQAASGVGHAASGVFATVSACSGTREQALLLQTRFNAICENMEGAAVAHICRLYNVPMLEMRGISNIVEDRDPSAWDIRGASDAVSRAVIALLAG